MKWEPPDNFYEGYSLWENLGYGPDGELNRARKLLSSLGYRENEEAVKDLLEMTKRLHEYVKTECQEEVQLGIEAGKKLKIAGESPPFDIWLAMAIANIILAAAQTGISVLQFIENRKLNKTDNPDIVRAAIKKLSSRKDANELIVEKTERWRVTYRKKD
jgi:hypothetical protein